MDGRVLLIKAIFIFYFLCFFVLFMLYCEQSRNIKERSEVVFSQIDELLKSRFFIEKASP